MKLFYTYQDILKRKDYVFTSDDLLKYKNNIGDKKLIFFCVNNNFEIDQDERRFLDFSQYQLNLKYDYLDINNKYLLYLRYYTHADAWQTYLFKKNKPYPFMRTCFDEINNTINDDIWYDPFYFIYEDDLARYHRYLKLKKIELS